MTSTHPYWLIFVAGIVALIPVIIGVATSYIKISVVLGMFRTGLGAQQVPSQLVIMALSLSMTLFIMAPVFEQSVDAAQGIDLAMIAEEPSVAKLSALKPLLTPWRDFMLTHVGEREYRVLEQMVLEMRVTAATQKQLSAQTASESLQEYGPHAPSLRVLLPAFIITELKEAFAMGFVLLLPFLAIDLIVSNVLMGLGMFMVSPMMISLPLKLIVFVWADGWLLLTQGLVKSYHVGVS